MGCEAYSTVFEADAMRCDAMHGAEHTMYTDAPGVGGVCGETDDVGIGGVGLQWMRSADVGEEDKPREHGGGRGDACAYR